GYLLSLDGEAIVVGNSLGGWLATLLAHRHPEHVARAVLVNGGALLNVPSPGLTLTPSDREAARRVMAAIRDPASPPIPDEVLDEIVARSADGPTARMLQDMPGLMSHLLDGRLGEVEVPVDIIWGESDRLMPLAYAQRMEEQLPRARLTTLTACGHVPLVECPERFLAALRHLLRQPPPAPSSIDAGGITVESEGPDLGEGGE
ncbi:MAG: alpha/beta hydrolase, partial [Thermoanaerobaculia bacterium]|nr:alpha/beta hydrolase [Thermoanaerobaculia bacterium]